MCKICINRIKIKFLGFVLGPIFQPNIFMYMFHFIRRFTEEMFNKHSFM